MDTFTARLGVSNGNGGSTQWVEALVDTGATFTVLPASLLRRHVGVQPTEHLEFTFANGERKTLPVGEARISVEDKEATSKVVFGEEGQYLLGATTPAGVRVDPRHEPPRIGPRTEAAPLAPPTSR